MKEITGGVCAAKGFLAGGIRCGIKPSSQKKDLALIYSKTNCSAAAVFTTNKVKAACVVLSENHIADAKLRAIIANSGNANACTGQAGIKTAKRMAQLVADNLLIDPSDVAVASTGVIGVPLPVDLIEKNIDALKQNLRSDELGHNAALEAIMTTDTKKKDIAVQIEIDGKAVHIGAMTKGSGMIHPNMATMLAFITTDAAILPSALNTALRQAVKKSFNRLTVDGDTSTNDMAVVMANGEAGNTTITGECENYKIFYNALEYVCIDLTKKMARDGEGATKLVAVKVTGAENEDTAEVLAKSAASSSLVKAACFGADANWGRVLCAMGYGAHNAGVNFNQDNVNISFSSKAGTVQVCKNGGSIEFSEEKAKLILLEEEIDIIIELNDKDGEATVWGCDLTYDYVKINGDYRS
ncbi:MAG: bifunctional ornithine acetyltransferase/N-acetylglutamate synthase [Treponema sp.]|jgi:glutamate N-acetyltransferase/amino-acid N-acetyltransferase|nr:bifunctional ornithine acetyltransferase/N-acetylglutamate synthase [Treponema sp.]